MKPIVEIKDLRVEYRGRGIGQAAKLAVDGLNLKVNPGEVFGFLGPNGAGKTTTMNVLLGFVNATGGEASLFGVNVREPIARQRIGYLPELTYYYKFLTVEELLRFYARIFGIPRVETDRRIDQLLKLVELEPVRKRTIKTYSKGMQQRVGLAQALINNPDLLILDEPTSGLDPIGRMKVREIIQRLKNEGKTVLFSSHELGEVETVCDRVAILHQGKLRVEGRVNDLLREHQSNLEEIFLKIIAVRSTSRAMNKIWALATVVIRELYRRKDFYVLFVLTGLITLVMASASFFKDSADGLKEISFLLIWISGLAIAVATAARQIPAERENRTIFPLLAKPVTRAHVVAGKFLGCWLACGAALLTFYTILIVISASREHALPVADYVQAFWMQWMFLAIVVAMVVWGSVVFAAPSSNATICIVMVLGILILGSHLNKVATDQPEPLRTVISAIYFIIPHLEWFNLKDSVIYSKEIVGWGYIALASCYALAYTALLLLGAWISFRGKALSK